MRGADVPIRSNAENNDNDRRKRTTGMVSPDVHSGSAPRDLIEPGGGGTWLRSEYWDYVAEQRSKFGLDSVAKGE